MKKLTRKRCPICFPTSKRTSLVIKEFSDSILYLHKDQFFKGYCILEYKSHIKELFDLTALERRLLMDHVSRVAKALQNALSPDKINYELLGNKVAHLHWHLIPRFKGDPAWSDPVWTLPHEAVKLSREQARQMVSVIQKYL